VLDIFIVYVCVLYLDARRALGYVRVLYLHARHALGYVRVLYLHARRALGYVRVLYLHDRHALGYAMVCLLCLALAGLENYVRFFVSAPCHVLAVLLSAVLRHSRCFKSVLNWANICS